MKNAIIAMLLLFVTSANAATIIDYSFDSQSWGSLNPNEDNPTYWYMQSSGGKDNTPAIRCTYSQSGTSGKQLMLDISSYQTNEIWVEFDTKIDNTPYGGMKFVKFFGVNGPSADNMTLIVDYNSNDQNRVCYNLDTLCEAFYDGHASGTCPSTQTWNVTGSPIDLGTGTWGHYKAHLKRATPGQRDGTLSVWWNGSLVSQMSNMASNETDNAYFSYMTFGDYSASTSGYSTWYFWIDNLYVGTTERGESVPATPSPGLTGVTTSGITIR